MRALLAVAAACLLTMPALAGATAPPESLSDQVHRLIVEGLGGLPDSAEVDGVAVPVEDALALLEDTLTFQHRAAGPVRLPDHDLGAAAGVPCTLPGGLFLAAAFGFGNIHAVDNAEEVAAGVPNCGPGGKVGAYGGDISGDAAFAIACTIVGAFVNEQGPSCHANDFGGVMLAGNYGGINFRLCLFGFCIELIALFVYLGVISLQA